jgi:hypothetical protein
MTRPTQQPTQLSSDMNWVSKVLPAPIGAALLLSGLLVAPLLGSATAANPQYASCPGPKHLVGSSTHWHHHRLAPDISLAEALVGKRAARLKVAVVRINLASRRAKLAPIHRGLSTRHHLTRLARRPHLVAATNGPYFDFGFGAPKVPVIAGGGPLVLSHKRTKVAGIGVDGRAEDGGAWLVGHASAPRGRHHLVAINEVAPPRGLSVYTSAWGSNSVPLPLFARSRVIRHGRVVGSASRHHLVPNGGQLLVATSAGAIQWLHALRPSSPLSLAYHAKTNARRPFAQAYGVGTQVVASANHVRRDLYCNPGSIYAARTDFAWRDHGRRLILATVASPRGGEGYGVDENQMSQIMVALGASRSFALDGGGSTELVTRLPSQHGLSIRNPGPHANQRAIPLGIGVYSLPKPPPPKHHGHKRHRKHRHHHKSNGGLLGGLLPLGHHH